MKKEDRVSLLDLDLSTSRPRPLSGSPSPLPPPRSFPLGTKEIPQGVQSNSLVEKSKETSPPATRMRKSQGRLRERRSSSRSSSAASDDDNDNDGSERASPQEKNVPLREQFHLGVGGRGARSSEKEEFLQGGAAVKKKKKL